MLFTATMIAKTIRSKSLLSTCRKKLYKIHKTRTKRQMQLPKKKARRSYPKQLNQPKLRSRRWNTRKNLMRLSLKEEKH